MTSHNLQSNCELCPRRCGVNRRLDERGFCGSGSGPQVYRYGPHMGEEPPISGSRGSGTIFFSRCTMRCIYCQNYPWSQDGKGRVLSVDGLADILTDLRIRGCHNWNLVSPTPWLHSIRQAKAIEADRGPALPVVYNTSGYERVETLREFGDMVDIYLTDLRYAFPESASEGSGTPDYPEVARRAFLEMWRQSGRLRCDGHGVAVSGTICRILILPEYAKDAIRNLRWIADNVGTDLDVSIMAQYVPTQRTATLQPWNRAITQAEYDSVWCEAERLGFGRGWTQEYGAGADTSLLGFHMSETCKR